jgi:hypothetical protein
MSANPGKVQVLGVTEIYGEKVIGLSFLQGRNPDWVQQPFFAQYDEKAIWLDELKPAFGQQRFFFEETSRPAVKARRRTSSLTLPIFRPSFGLGSSAS